MLQTRCTVAACLLLGAIVSAHDVDCEMEPFVAWSKCTEECDCGIQMRFREVKTRPSGAGKKCPHDSEARTCNCHECTKEEVAKQLLPAASAHGFTPPAYVPKGGFPTSYGEQAACVLDKAEAVIDLVPATFNCKKFSSEVGHPCYAESIEHLVQHLELCCEGREHFVLWKSDTTCAEQIAGMVQHLKDWISPIWGKCVNDKDASACSELKTEAEYNKFAKILEEGLSAAKELYSHGQSGDKTPAAEALLDVCVPEAKDDTSWTEIRNFLTTRSETDSETSKCLHKVRTYAQMYDKGIKIDPNDTRRRLLRGTQP